jgi:hypothetical protein
LRKPILALMAMAVIGLGSATGASARDSLHGTGRHAGWSNHRGLAQGWAAFGPGYHGSAYGYRPGDGGYYGPGGYYNVNRYGGCFRQWTPVMTTVGTRIAVLDFCE